MDRKGHGGKSWTPSKKVQGSERNEAEKSEDVKSGSSSETQRANATEGIKDSTRMGIVASDRAMFVKEGKFSDRDASDHVSEECVTTARRVSQSERDVSEKCEEVLVSSFRENTDKEGFSGKEVMQKEGLRVLYSKAVGCEKEGRSKIHSHSARVSPPPSSKNTKYEKAMKDTHLSKGIRSERDTLRKEDGRHMKDGVHHGGNKRVGEVLMDDKRSMSDGSSFETSRKDDKDAINKMISRNYNLGGETVTKDRNLSDFMEGAEGRPVRSIHRSSCLSLDEGSCKSGHAWGDEATDNDDDSRNRKKCSESDKSEKEEGELDPEADDTQDAAKVLQEPAVSQGAKCMEGKEEFLSTEDGEISPAQASELVGNGGANRQNEFTHERDSNGEVEKGTHFPVEAEFLNKNVMRRSWRGSEDNFDGAEERDGSKTMEVEVEDKTRDSRYGDHQLSSHNVDGLILRSTEREAPAKTLSEYVAVDHSNNVAGPLENAVNREPDIEPEDGHLQKRLRMEALEPPTLSLSLPDTSLSLGSPGLHRAGKAPSKTKSMRSMSPSEAHSNGVTTSLSLSYSQTFVHNPSCSLTQTSLDNQEFSSASQQVSQCNDQLSYGSWQISHGSDRAGSQRFMDVSSEHRKPHRELSLYQQLLQNGNLQMSQGSLGVERGREVLSQSEQKGLKRSLGGDRTGATPVMHGSKLLPPLGHPYKRNSEGSQGRSLEDRGYSSERRKCLPADLQEACHAWSSPSPAGGGSREKWVQQHDLGKNRTFRERESIKHENGVAGKLSLERNEDLSATMNSIDDEKVDLYEVVTNSVAVIAQKLSKLPESYVDGLKDSLKDMLVNSEKREEFGQLQKLLQMRTDLSIETLQRAHRAQLELLVAMKTGIQAFLNRDHSLTSLAMVEIFLQTRCRNIRCQNMLPVDDCDCTVCIQKNGFCSACMCIICSKFDFDANTCRWVGCDFCMHWCHSDCALRSSCIMPGQSIQGAAGTSEMQFKCIGCGQKSEMFGFVKDVFTTFARQWERDVLARELECVRRIFQESEDKRGKQLFEKAEQLLAKLESRADTVEVSQNILRFLEDGGTDTGNVHDQSKTRITSLLRDGSDKLQNDGHRNTDRGYPGRMDQLMDLEKVRSSLQSYELDLKEKHPEAAELQREKARNRAEVDELESMMRIKQAESQMFQLRADEARREAEALQRIVLAKCEKIQDGYASKLVKLRLNETEEKRRKKFEELKLCERSACEFNSMKLRVFADIQELLKKMEATKRQLL